VQPNPRLRATPARLPTRTPVTRDIVDLVNWGDVSGQHALLPPVHGQDETGTKTAPTCRRSPLTPTDTSYPTFLPSAYRSGARVGGIYSSSRVHVEPGTTYETGWKIQCPTHATTTAVPEPTHRPHISCIDRSNGQPMQQRRWYQNLRTGRIYPA
jgi:hypothetical protein